MPQRAMGLELKIPQTIEVVNFERNTVTMERYARGYATRKDKCE